MSDEIKEILERIKTYPEKMYCLSEKEKRILLDYITNLQQRCEYLERSNNRREDTIIGLRQENVEIETLKQENERLKKDYAKIVNDNCDYLKLEQENEDNLRCIKSLKEQLESVIKHNQELLEKWHKNNDKIVNLISEIETLKQENKELLKKSYADDVIITKAISKANDLYSYSDNEEYVDNYCKDLLNILQNGSDEE